MAGWPERRPPAKALPTPECDAGLHVAASEQRADVVCSMAAVVGLFTEVVADGAQGIRIPFTVAKQPEAPTLIRRPVTQQQTASGWNAQFLDQILPAALTAAPVREGSGESSGGSSGVGAGCMWSLNSSDGGDAVKIAFRAEGLVATPARTPSLPGMQASQASSSAAGHPGEGAIMVSKLEFQATAGTEALTTREAAALWIRQHLCTASKAVIIHCVPEAGAVGIVRVQAVDHLQTAQSSQFEPQSALQGVLAVLRKIAQLSEPGDYVMVHRAKQPGAFSLWKHDPSGAAAATSGHDLHACNSVDTPLPPGAPHVVTRWSAAADTIPGTFQPNRGAASGHCHQYRDHGTCAGPCPYPHLTMAEAVALGENTNQLPKKIKKKPKGKDRKKGKKGK